MTAFKPFAFEREFTLPTEDVVSGEDSLAEAIAGAEERGFAAGEAAALERFRDEREIAVQNALTRLVLAVEQIDAQSQALAAGLEAAATSLALSGAELLAGQAVAERPAGAVQQVLGELLQELRRGMPLELWVHPDLVPEIQLVIEEHRRGERRQRPITVREDPALQPGDGRIGWDQGFALVEAASRGAMLKRVIAETGQGH